MFFKDAFGFEKVKEKGKTYACSKTLPASIEEKEIGLWPKCRESPPNKKRRGIYGWFCRYMSLCTSKVACHPAAMILLCLQQTLSVTSMSS